MRIETIQPTHNAVYIALLNTHYSILVSNYIKYNWPSILWAAFILVICLMPGRDLPRVEIINVDKLVHIGVHTLLALLTYFGWVRQDSYAALHRHTFLKIALLLAVYGFSVEVMQEVFTMDRHYDLYDALANSIGAVVGGIAGRVIFR